MNDRELLLTGRCPFCNQIAVEFLEAYPIRGDLIVAFYACKACEKEWSADFEFVRLVKKEVSNA